MWVPCGTHHRPQSRFHDPIGAGLVLLASVYLPGCFDGHHILKRTAQQSACINHRSRRGNCVLAALSPGMDPMEPSPCLRYFLPRRFFEADCESSKELQIAAWLG